MSETNFNKNIGNQNSRISAELANAINKLCERTKDCDNQRLILAVGELKAYYRAYERTGDSLLLEDIVLGLVNVVNELLTTDEGLPSEFDFDNKPQNSFLAIDKKTGKLLGNCHADFKGGFSPFEDNKMTRMSVTFEDLMKAFEDRVSQESSQRGTASTTTARIYSNCIRNELLFGNGEYNLTNEIDIEQVKRAIDVAISRLREEVECLRREGSTKRHRTNELAALNKLRKLLDVLFRDIQPSYIRVLK